MKKKAAKIMRMCAAVGASFLLCMISAKFRSRYVTIGFFALGVILTLSLIGMLIEAWKNDKNA